MNTSYLASPDLLSRAFSFITFIEVPVQWFGVYCILFQTPESMKSVKFSMLNLLFWTVCFDWTMSFLTCPFILVPAVAGVPIGVLSQFGVRAEIQYYLCTAFFSAVNVSIVSLVEYRYFILYGKNRWWRVFRVPFFIFNYSVSLTYFIFPFCFTPSKTWAIQELHKKITNLPAFVLESNIFITELDSFLTYGGIILFEIIIINEIFVFGYLIVINLEKSARKTMISKRTYDIQRRLQLPYQFLSYLFFYFGPAIIFNIYNQVMNNFLTITISLHGFLSTIIMLYIHTPYQNFCIRLFSIRTKRLVKHEIPNIQNNWKHRTSLCTVNTQRNVNIGFHNF
ncbi:hypothetical protein CRE_08863 [Caenorhabditis remanei]|uniref:Serpentine Receptor, class H n=1 Tax=Caenorhabditis remanei TaxID=31234 RepID=E3LHY3_CAERE|nr:hypothetical protein CRE_08863 [Caenorhabditis remanei]